MITPHWVSAFLDLPVEVFEEGVRFWSGVTGYELSERRGGTGEFATLVPPEGEDFLRVQRIDAAPARIHLDLHVPDPPAATRAAFDRGADLVADHGRWTTMRSPGGLAFCFVTHPGSRRPPAMVHAGGDQSLVDQVCLDIPAARLDEECAFWAAITGWDHHQVASPEFSRLASPPGQPLRFLMQRLGDEDGPVRAHLDFAADSREAEVSRHVGLGATEVRRHRNWTVLHDPGGLPYCVTDRNPTSGVLPGRISERD